MKNIKNIALLAVVASILSPAFAADSTQALNISTTVEPSCVMTMPTDLSLNYNTVWSTNGFHVKMICTVNTSYNIDISAGKSGVESARYLQNANGDKLNYNMVQFNGSSYVPWGSGINSMFGIGTGEVKEVSASFTIPDNQYVSPGTYTDTLTVNLVY